jgi:hypothetical protein
MKKINLFIMASLISFGLFSQTSENLLIAAAVAVTSVELNQTTLDMEIGDEVR